MENTLHAIAIWAHILGIALFVGPQFFLAFAWVPASRAIADLPIRVQAMRTITRRFAYIGGAGLALIFIAGVYLISTWRDYYSIPDDTGFNSLRYGVLFSIKMTVLLVMLVVVGLHTFVVGPQQIELLDARAQGSTISDEEVRKVRLRSMALSITGLALVLVIMVLGALMNTAQYSLQGS